MARHHDLLLLALFFVILLSRLLLQILVSFLVGSSEGFVLVGSKISFSRLISHNLRRF